MSVKDRLTAFRPFRKKSGTETTERSESDIALDAKLDHAQAQAMWSSSITIGKTRADTARLKVRWEDNCPWATDFDKDTLETEIRYVMALKRIKTEFGPKEDRLRPFVDNLRRLRLATIANLYANEYEALASSGAEVAYYTNVACAAITIDDIFDSTDPRDTNRINTRISRELPVLVNNMGLAKKGLSIMPSPIIY